VRPQPLPTPLKLILGNELFNSAMGSLEGISRAKEQFGVSEVEGSLTPAHFATFAADPFWVSCERHVRVATLRDERQGMRGGGRL
jgi:hypothetical protein